MFLPCLTDMEMIITLIFFLIIKNSISMDTKFSITHLEWLNLTSFEIHWNLDETLANSVNVFSFKLISDDPIRFPDKLLKCPSTLRTVLVKDIAVEYTKIEGFALFSKSAQLTSSYEIRKCLALISNKTDIICCSEESCDGHDILLLSAKSKILAISYGDTRYDFFAISQSALIWHHIRFNQTKIFPISIGIETKSMDYDWLNKYITVISDKKLFQINFTRKSIVEISCDKGCFYVDGAVDPLNGYLHLLINNNSIYYYINILSLNTKNDTLTNCVITRIKIPFVPYSLLLDSDYMSLKILGERNLATYFLDNSSLISTFINFNTKSKLQKFGHGYVAWTTDAHYQIEKDPDNKYHIINVSQYSDYYINAETVYRVFPVPVLPFQIINSFIGSNFISSIWTQNIPEWQTVTSWKKFQYKITIFSNESKIYSEEVGLEKVFIYNGLPSNSFIRLTVTTDDYVQSVSGKSLSENITSIPYYIIQNGTIEAYKVISFTFDVKKIDSELNGRRDVKDLQVFKNVAFILLTNGTIIKISSKAKEKILEDVQALRYDIDYQTGNVYFIDVKSRWLYRYRPGKNETYKIDLIKQNIVEDFKIFPKYSIILHKNATGLHLSNMNGLSIDGNNKSIQMENTSIKCDNRSINIIKVNGVRKIITSSDEENRCFPSEYGLITISTDSVYLKNWEGNSSLKLFNRLSGISKIRLLNQVEYKEVHMEDILKDSLTFSRSKSDDLILSWNNTDSMSRASFIVIIFNKKINKSWKFIINRMEINIKSYATCGDQILVDIRQASSSTHSDSVIKRFITPCTTDVAEIKDFFLIKKDSQSDSMAILEMKANFNTKANSAKIDGKYDCNIDIILTRNSGSQKSIGSKTISCLDKYYLNFYKIPKLYQFQWNNICLNLTIGPLSTLKCVDIGIMRTNEKSITLQYFQRLIFTCSIYNIKRIVVSPNRKIVSVINVKGKHRNILITKFPITKIELDWVKNNLFWSEQEGKLYMIFSVYLNNNNVNLWDDKVLWYSDNKPLENWTIHSIIRKLIIKSKKKELTFNIDGTPGWTEDHDVLVKCEHFKKMNETIRCTENQTNSYLQTNQSNYYFTINTLVIYKDLDEPMCKLVHVKENYAIPSFVKKCWVITIFDKKTLKDEHAEIIIQGNGNDSKIIDENGNVFENKFNSKSFVDLSLNNTNVSISLRCDRYFAVVQLISERNESNFNFHVMYVNKNTTLVSMPKLLRNNIVDAKRHTLKIVGFEPDTIYKFTFTINTKDLSISNSSSCQCVTENDVPSPVHNSTLSKLNAIQYEIVWSNSQNNGYHVTEYDIKIRITDSIFKSYSSKETKYIFSINQSFLLVEIRARNKLGYSLPSYVYLNSSVSKKQTGFNENYVTMAYATFFTLIIIFTLGTVTWILIVYRRYGKIKILNNQTNLNHNVNGQRLEMENMVKTIKYDVNPLYGLEELPLTNFDKIPHILNECITYSHLIGNGAFGMVFKGTIRIESDNNLVCKQVALKIKNGNAISEEDFKREAILLYKYSHPNIIELYGVSFDCPDKQCLILEYMEKGNLRQYLQNHRPSVLKSRMNSSLKSKIINENSILSIKDLINIASDILKALIFLETKNFVHRDIAARNCLVSLQNRKNRITKLGDFGLARDIYSDEYYRKVSETKLPVRWMAPETIKDSIFTGKSDVWSFGVLCWEIMTFGADPYMGQVNSEVIKEVIAGKHLERPSNCPIEFYEIMLQCWKYYSECRPNFSEIDILFQYLEEIKDFEEISTSSRIIIRSYDSSHDSEFGRNSDPLTEKTSITVSDKYGDTYPFRFEKTPVQLNYDNFGYEVPTSPLSVTTKTFTLTNSTIDNLEKSA